MVSLRKRTSRPSYVNIHADLSHLSDEDVEGASKNPNSQNSDENGESSGSLSSGDSSEFQPEDNGSHAKQVKSESISDDEDDDEAEEDEKAGTGSESEAPGTPIAEIDETTTPQPGPSKRPPPPTTTQPQVRASIQSRMTTDTNAFPPGYRKLLLESSNRMGRPSSIHQDDEKARAREKERQREKERGKYRNRSDDVLPWGGSLPFVTRLVSVAEGDVDGEGVGVVLGKEKSKGKRAEIGAEKGKGVRTGKGKGKGAEHGLSKGKGKERQSVKWVDEPGTKDERRTRGFNLSKMIPLICPSEAWEGEGWWPEMYLGAGTGRDGRVMGRGNKEEWILREEVRMGLEGVGRLRVDELELLSDSEAEPFLPKFIDAKGNPWVTCHLGPHDQQVPIDFGMFDTKAVGDYNTVRDGFVFCAGGPIWGLDWCPYPDHLSAQFGNMQYLAVTTMPHIETRPSLGVKWPQTTPGAIQIWSVKKADADGEDKDKGGGEMKCEMVLCVDGGRGMEVRWMPLGAWDEVDREKIQEDGIPKLGIVAVAQLDGSVSLYTVPYPQALRDVSGRATGSADKPLFLRLQQPLLRLEVADAMCTCMDFMTGSKLAVGLSNGHAVVWDIVEALRSPSSEEVLPSYYFAVTHSALRSITSARLPPGDDQGQPQYGEDPPCLIFGSHDGSASMVDLRDTNNILDLNKARTSVLATGWVSQLASPIYTDVDHALNLQKVFGKDAGRKIQVAVHRGQVWSLATSDYHTMITSAGSDGALLLVNLQSGFYRRRGHPLLWQRMYEIDYDNVTGHYRIIDDFMPETMTAEQAAGKVSVSSKSRGKTGPETIKSANWSPHVGLHRTRWNNAGGIFRAGWLVSGGASGLGRVDFVKGRWRGGRVPLELL